MEAERGTLTLDNYDDWKRRWERRCLPYRRLTVRTSIGTAQVEQSIRNDHRR